MDVLSQYFKPVPSNPYYYFYCPLSSKKDVSPQLLPGRQQIQNGDLDKESGMAQESFHHLFLFVLAGGFRRWWDEQDAD